MHPIHKQRTPPHFNYRTETLLSGSPSTPHIGAAKNRGNNSNANHQEVWTRMPEIIVRIQGRRYTVQPPRESTEDSAACSQQSYGLCNMSARPSAHQNKARDEPGKGKRGPREYWE